MARTIADYTDQELRNMHRNILRSSKLAEPAMEARLLAVKDELAKRESKKGGRGPNWYLVIDVRDGDVIGVGPGPEQYKAIAKWEGDHVRLIYEGRDYSLFALKTHLGVPWHSKSTINGKYLDDLASGAMRED